jgi:hypothetical protein
MRVICIGLLAIGLAGCVTLIGSSSTFAKGLCTGSRECPETVAVADAAKAWSNCLFESAAVQIQKTQDQNSALEAALAACQTQEDGLIALRQSRTLPQRKRRPLDLFFEPRRNRICSKYFETDH